MMAKTQIALEPEMLRGARERAAAMGISLAEYVRRLVARDLVGAVPSTDPSRVFNLGDSGGSDIGRYGDAMVAEALEAEDHRDRGGR